MERDRAKFDILQRILEERNIRGWSEYTLAQRSEVPQSTISTWYRKNLQPSVATIEKICNAFDMTLAQFFSKYDSDSVKLSKDQAELLTLWDSLSKDQRDSILAMIRSFVKNP